MKEKKNSPASAFLVPALTAILFISGGCYYPYYEEGAIIQGQTAAPTVYTGYSYYGYAWSPYYPYFATNYYDDFWLSRPSRYDYAPARRHDWRPPPRFRHQPPRFRPNRPGFQPGSGPQWRERPTRPMPQRGPNFGPGHRRPDGPAWRPDFRPDFRPNGPRPMSEPPRFRGPNGGGQPRFSPMRPMPRGRR
ncbi:MAG: hypothetical protein LBU39_00990 [Desulfobulbaceae bacterium]|jgi:hypothetical protein|nr:hypothetical protein [Desulfobulbaceae bacterium]